MPHIYNSGNAIVTSDPNTIPELQSGHKIRIASSEDGADQWRFVETNPPGSRWVQLSQGILWSTPVDASIVPDTANAYDVGSFFDPMAIIYANYISLRGSASRVQMNFWNTPNYSSSGNGGFYINPDGNFQIFNPSGTGHSGNNFVLDTQAFTARRTATFPDKDGTVAYLSDIPAGGTPTGLEQLDEGAGDGWRLIGQNPANYGNIGASAVDLSQSLSASGTRGATGQLAFASGLDTTASGNWSNASGRNTVASGTNSHAEGFATNATQTSSHSEGSSTTASGTASHSEGQGTTASGSSSHAEGNSTTASGTNSHAGGQQSVASGNESRAVGLWSFARSVGEMSLGVYPTDYTPVDAINVNATDRVFNVGNGTTNLNRSDALTIFKNGEILAPSLDNTTIDNASSDVLVTKDWVNTNASGGQVDSVVAGTGITVDNTDPVNPIINSTGGGDAFLANTQTFTGTNTFTSNIITQGTIFGNQLNNVQNFNRIEGILHDITGGTGIWRLEAESSGANMQISKNSGVGAGNELYIFQGDGSFSNDDNVARKKDLLAYEEGTWTGTATLVDTGGTGITFNVNQAFYVKIGNMVTLNLFMSSLNTSGTPLTGQLEVRGLPFPVDNSTGSMVGNAVLRPSSGTTLEQVVATAVRLASIDRISIGRDSIVEATMGLTFSGNANLRVTITYRTT